MANLATGGQSLSLRHPGFIATGSALLMAALVTDIMYYQTSLMEWANFSAWLISGGLVIALVAAIFMVIDLLTRRAERIAWIPFVLVAAAALLSLLNAFVHSRDAWTSVVPDGITLSVIVTALLLISAFVYGYRVTTLRVADLGVRS